MRLIKVLSLALLAVAAVLGGVVVAAVIAVATIAAWLVRRFVLKAGRQAPPMPARARARGRPTGPEAEVIDVTATEIPGASSEG